MTHGIPLGEMLQELLTDTLFKVSGIDLYHGLHLLQIAFYKYSN